MCKYILFDFDGTLIDSNEIIVNSLNETALKFTGSVLSEKELQSILGKPLSVQMKEIKAERWEELDTFYRQYYRSHRDALTKIFHGTKDMLEGLKSSGCVLGIVSNKGQSGIQHGLEMFDLKSYFDVVISSDDVLQKKPHVECIEKALAVLEGTLSETMIVGDSIHDIECGKNAGIKTVLVDWTIADKNAILALGPDYVIESPENLVDIIDNNL